MLECTICKREIKVCIRCKKCLEIVCGDCTNEYVVGVPMTCIKCDPYDSKKIAKAGLEINREILQRLADYDAKKLGIGDE